MSPEQTQVVTWTALPKLVLHLLKLELPGRPSALRVRPVGMAVAAAGDEAGAQDGAAGAGGGSGAPSSAAPIHDRINDFFQSVLRTAVEMLRGADRYEIVE